MNVYRCLYSIPVLYAFTGPCPPGQKDKCIYLYGMSYVFERVKKTWEEAKYKCLDENGFLANLADDRVLNQVVEGRTKQQKDQYSYWIGLTRVQWVIHYNNGKFNFENLL